MTIARNVYDMEMTKYVPEDPICVMLDTDNPLLYPDYMTLPIFQEAQYFGKSKYMQGVTEDHHITVRYGILPHVHKLDVCKVLERWTPHNSLTPRLGGLFGNSYFSVLGPPDVDYEAVVIPIEITPFLAAVNTELGCLPNLNTFPYYEPHITVGYFKKGFWETLDRELYPPVKREIGTKSFRITGGES